MLALLGGAAFVLAAACGRTGLTPGQLGGGGAGGEGAASDEPPPVECTLDTDCPTGDACAPAFCHAPDDEHEVAYCATRVTDCSDADPCTLDACNPTDGRCTHQGPLDADHDGVLGKARAGTPESCGGPDCDDDDRRVYQGAPEICDGKDDNCDGRVDEGATYAPAGTPVQIAPNSVKSEPNGLAFDGTSYGVTYTETAADKSSRSYFALLDVNGKVTFGPSRVNDINADAFAGSVATPGKGFLTTWADARQSGSYEVYATRFDQQAQKLEPDQRLSNGPDMSLGPVAVYTGSGYAVVWNDRRFEDSTGTAIFGRTLGADGHARSDELRLTADGEMADSVDAAGSEARVGIAYAAQGAYLPDGSPGPSVIRFRSYDAEFGDAAGPVEFGTAAQGPSIVRAGDYFVVAWHTANEALLPGPVLQAATLDERGSLLATGPITAGDLNAKERALVSLGDRVLVVWSAIPAGGLRYELFYEVISARDLSVIVPRQSLVASTLDLQEPNVRLGPNGDVGVTYHTAGTAYQAYFTHLGCKL